MTTQRICPDCGVAIPADAPGGACPACSGLGAPTVTPVTRPSSTETELAARLPDLEDFALLGRGGMGTVYRARHRHLQRPVAVKVLDPALGADPSFAERFTREARTLAQLDHPNVVRVHDAGHQDDFYYLVMELVDGVSLRQTIEAGELDPARALAMVPQICEALQYAHDQGVVHRDIKPENILVDRRGRVKIADFGLAMLVGHDTGPRLTRPRQIMGTPHYMAPEQIEDPGSVDHRADIFALGVVFYELLTGGLPVGRFAPPSERAPIDARLDEVVLRTLEQEPSRRYQQASELKTDVESLSPQVARNAAAATLRPRARSGPGFEYKSPRRLFGLPLVHIHTGTVPDGKGMSVASGVIAIGDIAIGGVAIGGFAFGGVAVGGLALGLVALGGCVLGLVAALGGVAFGGIAAGGVAVGALAAAGQQAVTAMALTEVVHDRAMLAGWVLIGMSVIAAVTAAVGAWLTVERAEDTGR